MNLFSLACPKCKKEFHRRFLTKTLQRKTSCPTCGERFIREDAVQFAKTVKLIKKHTALDSEEVIRGSQLPNSRAEADFKARCFQGGWKPHRPSWPDFLIESDSELLAVEVKSAKDKISEEQARTFDLLEKAGVPVYIWKEDSDGGSLLAWSEIKGEL